MTASRQQGLLLVLSQPRPDGTEEFNRWYDEEHVPPRILRPGWLTARRYVAVDAPDAYLALYDLADLALLDEPSYQKLRSERSPRERRVIGALVTFDRRVYRPTHQPAPDAPPVSSACGRYLLCVWWDPDPERLDVFHRWYDEEHIPMLSEVPGWRRSRRFTLASGSGPRYLVMHDLDHLDVFSDPGYSQAVSTPLRDRAVGQVRRHERQLYSLLRDFDAPEPRSTGDGPVIPTASGGPHGEPT